MKKTLALLLCLAMLVTALSVNVFAVEAPSVEVITHESTASGDTTFAIKLSGFDTLPGVKLIVDGDDGVKMESASALYFVDTLKEETQKVIELKKDEDYVISNEGHTLTIVGLHKATEGDIITVAAKVNVDGASHEVSVRAESEFAKDGKEMYDNVKFTPGEIAPYVKSEEVAVPEIPEDATETTVTQELAGKNYFIPYGAVYNVVDESKDEYEYLKKDAEGKFVVSADTKVVKFPIPDNGFGTYGVSDGTYRNSDTKQFGNYVAEYEPETKTYGTFAIVGDWAEYRDWYLSNKGYSDAELVKKIYASYINKINTQEDGKHCYKAYGIDLDKNGEADYVIQVVEVEQNNYLWKNATQLEYGVRFIGLYENKDYATVAMYKEGETVAFAKEIKVDKSK